MSIFKKKMDKESERLKELVREKYGQIAKDAPAPGQAPPKPPASCCCCSPSPSPCCAPAADPSASTYYAEDVAGLKDAYGKLDGHVEEADLGLGCGLPTEHAGLAPGQTVVDLGSGAGNDVFIARSVVGETGRVIGVDMTPEMIAKARENAARRGFRNVEFRLGDIETLPVDDASADVVVSNCVLNLVPDKTPGLRRDLPHPQAGRPFLRLRHRPRGRAAVEAPGGRRTLRRLRRGRAPVRRNISGSSGRRGSPGSRSRPRKGSNCPRRSCSATSAPDGLAAYRASGAAVLSITVVGTRPQG